jgi:hypothetical protein
LNLNCLTCKSRDHEAANCNGANRLFNFIDEETANFIQQADDTEPETTCPPQPPKNSTITTKDTATMPSTSDASTFLFSFYFGKNLSRHVYDFQSRLSMPRLYIAEHVPGERCEQIKIFQIRKKRTVIPKIFTKNFPCMFPPGESYSKGVGLLVRKNAGVEVLNFSMTLTTEP